jgi:hypothetical protein
MHFNHYLQIATTTIYNTNFVGGDENNEQSGKTIDRLTED